MSSTGCLTPTTSTTDATTTDATTSAVTELLLVCNNARPCVGENTTANVFLYAREISRVVRQAAADPLQQPRFAFLALHDCHQPVEAPEVCVCVCVCACVRVCVCVCACACLGF